MSHPGLHCKRSASRFPEPSVAPHPAWVPSHNLSVINRAFREGWGAVVAKTVSLDSSKVINVTPRYAKLYAGDRQEVIGWENIELISDRPFGVWLDEFKRCKDAFPQGVLIASIMEEYRKDAWIEIVERCQGAGVDAFELNFSCPHGLTERKMGSAMGEDPAILEEVCGWVSSVAKKPAWAKMTPNITHIEEPTRAALRGGCGGISAINTIRSVMGVNLDTLRPEPSVEGYTTPGGYSSKAIKPIALRMCMEIATLIRAEFPGRALSGLGGIESGEDAAQFILLGADTVQVCTGVMKFGYGRVKPMCEQLLAFMAKHKFATPGGFPRAGASTTLPTHADLVQGAGRRAKPRKKGRRRKGDEKWSGDEFVKQSDAPGAGEQ